MGYKEKILADFEKMLPLLGISGRQYACLVEGMKLNLSPLPSEKEMAKGKIEEYIAEIGVDTVHDKGKALLIHLFGWLDKETE